MKKIFRNARTLIGSPRLIPSYAGWLLGNVRGEATRKINGVTIGGFVNFSEYHSADRALDADEVHFLRRFQLREGALIDVGANIGVVSLFLSTLHPARRIISLEPAPSTFNTLTSNVARSGASVECHRYAIAESDGTIKFVVKPKARANSGIVGRGIDGDEGSTVEQVACRSLDSLISELSISQISLLKIDTEGHEMRVLIGATKILSEFRPHAILFEVCPDLTRRAGFDAAAPAAALEAAGYNLNRITYAGRLEPVRASDAEGVGLANWVALDARAGPMGSVR